VYNGGERGGRIINKRKKIKYLKEYINSPTNNRR
jgi:hypothetical protein